MIYSDKRNTLTLPFYLFILPGDGQPQADLVAEVDSSSYNYDHLKGIDPIAANRIHPNNHRKVGF